MTSRAEYAPCECGPGSGHPAAIQPGAIAGAAAAGPAALRSLAPASAPAQASIPAPVSAPAAASAPTAAVPSEEGLPDRWLILAVLAAVAFMAQLDLFIVNVALPQIGQSYGAIGLSGPSWVLNAYAVVFAALLVPAGRLADHFGRRRFLLAGVAIFTLASAACGAAPTLGLLVGARAVQAIGAAMIVPTSLGLLFPAFARRHHAKVVGIWAGVGAVASSTGPPLGGLLVGVDWRWIFFINVPIGALTLAAGWRVLPEVRAAKGARLPDVVSAVTLLAAVTLLILATVQGPDWGWTDPRTLGLFAAALIATVATVTRTLRYPHALIEKTLFLNRDFTFATVAMFLYYVAFAILLLSSVLFLQGVWHYGPLKAGLAITPGPATAAVLAVNAGRLSNWFGRTIPAVVGCLFAVVTAAFWLIAASSQPHYLTGFLPGMLAGGVAAGLTMAPLLGAASTLPADRATTGSAVLNMSRQVGSAVGVAAVVVAIGTSVPTVGGFHRAWVAEIIAAALGALAAMFSGRGAAWRRSSPPRSGQPGSGQPASGQPASGQHSSPRHGRDGHRAGWYRRVRPAPSPVASAERAVAGGSEPSR